MTLNDAFALILFVSPLQFSPGPANIYFASIGGTLGLKKVTAPLLGHLLATFVTTVILGYGIQHSISTHKDILLLLQVVGAIYIFWLSYQFLKVARSTDDIGELELEKKVPHSFMSGVLVFSLNPKAYLIIALLLTQFASNATLNEILLISTILIAIAAVCFILWAYLGKQISQFSKKNVWFVSYLYFLALFASGAFSVIDLIKENSSLLWG